MKTGHLKNKRALITGASAGIGRAVALSLADEGCHVALVARSLPKLKEVATECEEKGVKVAVIPYDLVKSADTASLVEKTIGGLGGLDILINNAGASSSSPVDKANLDDWDRVIDVNLRSMIHLTNHSLKEIEKNPWGAVINISSVAGKMTFGGSGIYCATKHAVMGLTGSLYEDVREKNIKVCAICPGFVNTGFVSNNKINREKMIQPDDVADTVRYVLNSSDTFCPTEITMRPQRSPYN